MLYFTGIFGSSEAVVSQVLDELGLQMADQLSGKEKCSISF